jgi:beta-lactamase regulating signal transducer with metallopeptidase domain/Tol biopolymer transport system component
MIGQINRIVEIWWNWMWPMFWQVSLLIAFIEVADYLLRRHLWPQIRHAMWLLVLVKLLLPPTFALPTGIVSHLHLSTNRPLAKQYDEDLTSDALLPEEGFRRPGRGPRGYAESRESTASTGGAFDANPGIATTSEASAHLSWQAVAMVGWLVGGVMLAIWLAAGYARLSRIYCKEGSRDRAPESFMQLLADTARRLRLRRLPRVVVSQNVQSPAVFGVFRPVLLLPARGTEDLTPREVEHILLHELAHVKRRDLQVHAFCIAIQVIYWFNPLLYLVRRQLQHLRELCCDATVAGVLKEGTKDYCQTLVETAEWLLRQPSARGIGFLGLVENPNRLLVRLRWLQKGPPQHPRLRIATTLLVGGLLFAFLLPMAEARKPASSLAEAGSVDSLGTGSPSTLSLSRPALPPGQKTMAPAASDVSVALEAIDMRGTEEASLAGESDTVVDLKTGLTFKPLVSVSGDHDIITDESGLSLSPNGKFLLWQGWMVPLDGSSPFKLEELRGTADAAWSPDSAVIAFRSQGMWLLPVSPETGRATGPARKLADDDAAWRLRTIEWSADAEQIHLPYGDGEGTLHPVCLSVQDGEPLSTPEDPNSGLDYTRFGLRSRDGQWVAFSRYFNAGGVWVVPAAGGPPKLAAMARQTSPLWWSPDAQWLLCGPRSGSDSPAGFEFVRVVDHCMSEVTVPESAGKALGLSSDGKHLLFYKSSYAWRTVVKVATVSGEANRELIMSRQFDSIESLCSPDSNRLTFVGTDNQGKDSLMVAPLAGGSPVEVKINVSPGGDSLYPWLVSPDGKRLFFGVNRGIKGGRNLFDFYVIGISLERGESTGEPVLVCKDWLHPEGGTAAAWSPDSTRLVMNARGQGKGDLWVVPADGSPAKQLTRSPDEAEGNPALSPDGQTVAYAMASSGRTTLYTLPSEGGTPRSVWTQSGTPRYAWFPNSREIGVLSNDAIVAISITDGKIRPFLKLADAGFDRLEWFGWSPDGQTLGLYGSKDSGNYDIALLHASDGSIQKLPKDTLEKQDFCWTPDSQAICYVACKPERVRPAGMIYELDLDEAFQNAVVGALPASIKASSPTRDDLPPLVNGEYTDHFDGPLASHWKVSDPRAWPNGVHEVQNGELVVENATVQIGGQDWTNYVFNVRMYIQSLMSHNSMAGVAFRRNGGRVYWLAAWPCCQWLELGLISRGPANEIHVATITHAACDLAFDKWYTMEVEVRGGRIKASVDGRPVIEADDATHPQGAIELRAQGARIHYDDFSVRLLP